MKEFKNKRYDNPKKILTGVVGVIIVTIIVLFIIFISSLKDNNNDNKNTANSVNENKISWQDDASKIIDSLIYEDNFYDFYNTTLNYAEDNIFAKKIKEKSEKIDYINLEQPYKDVWEIYFYEMFKETENGISTNDINNKKISKAYWSDFEYLSLTGYPLKSRILYITFDDEPDKILSYRVNLYGDLYYTEANTVNVTLTDGLKVYFEDIYGDDWMLHTENKSNTTEIIIDELDSNYLQQMINNGADLLNFLKQYRDEIYKGNKTAQDEIDKENSNKNSIPKVGMTASEVRSSKWGYPDKINKDTYSWGTREQWVYNKYGYVYFKNGIVSSVSER